jgi:hypothetical protein
MSQQRRLPRRGVGWNREGNSRMQAHTMRDWLNVGGFADDIQTNLQGEVALQYLPLNYDLAIRLYQQSRFPEGRAAITCKLQINMTMNNGLLSRLPAVFLGSPRENVNLIIMLEWV